MYKMPTLTDQDKAARLDGLNPKIPTDLATMALDNDTTVIAVFMEAIDQANSLVDDYMSEAARRVFGFPPQNRTSSHYQFDPQTKTSDLLGFAEEARKLREDLHMLLKGVKWDSAATHFGSGAYDEDFDEVPLLPSAAATYIETILEGSDERDDHKSPGTFAADLAAVVSVLKSE